MSDNKLTNINTMSDEQIMQAIGQDDGSSSGSNIPLTCRPSWVGSGGSP